MKNELVLGKSKKGDGYTVFKNLDEAMVNEIKNFQMPVTVFNAHNHHNSKIVQVLNDKQNLCIDDSNEYFIATNDAIQDYLKTNKLNAINQKFSVVEALKKSIGSLYNYSGFCEFKFTKNNKVSYDDLGSIGYSEIGIELSTYGGITVSEKSGKWSSIMFCYLNEDGNIENRDYNIDIAKHLNNKPKTKDDLILEIINNIPNVPYKNYGNKWFSKEFAFILNKGEFTDRSEEKISLSLTKLNKASGDNYGDSRSGRAKMPIAAVDVTREHLLQQILPIVNEIKFGGKVDLSKYISLEPIAETKVEAVVPKKRIQKTKINEKKYDVYDFTEDEEEFDEEIIQALKDIEQSINIPDNVTIVMEFLEDYLHEGDLPSFSFDKGEAQEDHSKYKGYVKMPYGCNFTFRVCEGDACEITWSHSIYETDIIDLEFVD